MHFKNEKTKLEECIEKHSGHCKMTPKCHPEIASIGIEYIWRYAKLTYQKKIKNSGIVHLEENTKKALSNQDALTINRTIKFSRKASNYKLTYYFLIQTTKTTMAKMDKNDGSLVK